MSQDEVNEVIGENAVSDRASPGPTGVGARPVGRFGIVLLIIYFIALCALVFYSLIQFLPESNSTNVAGAALPTMPYLWWNITIAAEMRLFIAVALAGSLGSLVHALRSLYWYIGNRALVRSWIPKYILMPFVGATMAVAFYFVIRGGFFAAGTSATQTNAYVFVAVGVLIGMFTEQAVLKLKEVAETMLAKPHPGNDPAPEKTPDKPPET